MQEDLYRNHDDLKSVRQMGRLLKWTIISLLARIISFWRITKTKKSEIYQRLISENPQYELYLQTLYDTSVHDNYMWKLSKGKLTKKASTIWNL